MLFWHLGLTAGIVFLTLGRRRIDYRVVLLGAILPDLIDKPIGRVFFPDQFENSRLFGHTFLFAIALLLVIQLVTRGATARRWFVLPIAVLIHLALDGMWNEPVTLFWPLFGLEFPRMPMENYWWEVFIRLFQHPIEGLKELAGLAVLLYMSFAYELHKRTRLREFVRTGTLADRGHASTGNGRA
jgi:hypothetical protein